MHCQSVLLALAAASSCVVAGPLVKKADYAPLPGGDITILNYALTLEYLERKFYMEGLANYTAADFKAAGFDDAFYGNLKEVYYDEKVRFLYFAQTPYLPESFDY
jgi:hypothetical protein